MSTSYPITLCHIFISPGHNYFGHHGKDPGEHPIVEVDAVQCVAGRGLMGDRFFDYKEDYKGQVTFFAWETYIEMRNALDVKDRPPSACRRNVFTEGVDLNPLVGTRFEIQGIVFDADSECTPCYWMDRAFAPGAEEHLQGFGGLRARIEKGGTLRTGPCALSVLSNE